MTIVHHHNLFVVDLWSVICGIHVEVKKILNIINLLQLPDYLLSQFVVNAIKTCLRGTWFKSGPRHLLSQNGFRSLSRSVQENAFIFFFRVMWVSGIQHKAVQDFQNNQFLFFCCLSIFMAHSVSSRPMVQKMEKWLPRTCPVNKLVVKLLCVEE